jgi:hypothetical protein
MKAKLQIITLTVGLLLNANLVKAQNFCYNQGDNMLNIGISPITYGFGYNYNYGFYKNSSYLTFPALNANYQIGFHEFISAGVTVGRFSRVYKSTYENYTGYINEYKDSYSYTMVGAMAEVHLDNMLESLDAASLNLGEEFDVYVGFSTGLFFSNWRSKDVWYTENKNVIIKHEQSSSGGSVRPFMRSYIGGRYMFKPALGVFLNLGYSSFGYMNLGVTFKM